VLREAASLVLSIPSVLSNALGAKSRSPSKVADDREAIAAATDGADCIGATALDTEALASLAVAWIGLLTSSASKCLSRIGDGDDIRGVGASSKSNLPVGSSATGSTTPVTPASSVGVEVCDASDEEA
jgi:hypothetical protein